MGENLSLKIVYLADKNKVTQENTRSNLLALLQAEQILLSFFSSALCAVQPILVVHGGAGGISNVYLDEKLICVKRAARVGYDVLVKTGNVLDAIEAAIHIMEDDPLFNAGKGSVLNLAGGIEMDALITEGKNLDAGSVALVRNIAHPISLARLVMEKTPHTFLGGDGLEDFIIKQGIPRVPEYNLTTANAISGLEWFINSQNFSQIPVPEIGGDRRVGVGTVGCVAVDSSGHVASGTSTGGAFGKWKGRIGDSPLPGCGGYSDDEIGAVSTTGHGESIMRYNLAHRILTLMNYGESAQNATAAACQGMTKKLGKHAGAITVSIKGEVGISFTTNRMVWAYQVNDEIHYGVDQGQHLIEKIVP